MISLQFWNIVHHCVSVSCVVLEKVSIIIIIPPLPFVIYSLSALLSILPPWPLLSPTALWLALSPVFCLTPGPEVSSGVRA